MYRIVRFVRWRVRVVVRLLSSIPFLVKLGLYGLCSVSIVVEECRFKVNLTCLPSQGLVRPLRQSFASKI